MRDVAVDDDIVARLIRQFAKYAFQHSLPFDDIDDFVSLRIPIEVIVDLVRLHIQHADVVVEQQRQSIERWAATLFSPRRQEMPMPERGVVILVPSHLTHAARGFDRRRWVRVVEQ